MNYLVRKTVLSDIGQCARINQDSVLCRTARCDRFGRICFALVCDGLGGLSHGEVASSSLSGRMEKWFTGEFTRLISGAGKARLDAGQCLHRTRLMWQSIVMEMNDLLAEQGREQGIRMGTTVVAFLLLGQQYLVMHVGDSRLYMTRCGMLELLTHDHSLVQMKQDAGILTPHQALHSEYGSVLLQCVGASHVVRPDFKSGTLFENTSVLLCSDGFWRRLRVEEILSGILPDHHTDESTMSEAVRALVETIKQRGEPDNISAVFLNLTAENSIPAIAPVSVRQALVC
ncbi:MAG: serine/threonine-protein phosphatase [Lachnospiraceae bacterium]|nr:serine/threonine-protein phosphatase [Lachnospiraceae bacterium]